MRRHPRFRAKYLTPDTPPLGPRIETEILEAACLKHALEAADLKALRMLWRLIGVEEILEGQP